MPEYLYKHHSHASRRRFPLRVEYPRLLYHQPILVSAQSAYHLVTNGSDPHRETSQFPSAGIRQLDAFMLGDI
jgi:hypothetical protein